MNEKDCIMLQYLFEEMNITKAAERLFMTQPAITYRLQQIEKEYGINIYAKTGNGKGFKFTPEGEYLVRQAKKTLLEIRKTKDYILNMSREVQGKLRIGAHSYYSRYILPSLLKNFIGIYPKVEFNVHTGFSFEVLELLQNEEVHVAIIRGNYEWFEEKFLIDEENICLISKEPINIEELPNLPRINYSIDAKLSYKVRNYMNLPLTITIKNWWYERFNKPPLITMQVDSYETCKEMVKNGLGYAIVPRAFVNPNDELYSINLSLKDGQIITVKTWMLYRASSLQLTTVDKFVHYIKSLHEMLK